MKEKLMALVYPLLTMLTLFGVNLSEGVKQTLAENVTLLITAFGALGSILPSVLAAFKRT